MILLLGWSAAAWTPLHDWNAARFYPAYLLAGGEPVYAVANAGIANGWIYGPMLPLALAPLTQIPDETHAMMAAGWFNIAVLFVPILVLVDAVAGRALPLRRRFLVAALTVGVLLLLPTTNSRLVFITADQMAIGLGVISCLALHESLQSTGARAECFRFGAALLVAAAMWTKQTETLVPFAQLGFLCWRRSRRDAWRYGVALAVVQGGMLLLMGGAFGWSELWFNVVWVPTHHPLAAGWRSLAEKFLWMLLYTGPLIAAYLWAGRRQSPGEETALRARELADQLFVAGLALLPAGILAAAKIGGDENSFHAVYFFALAAGVIWAGPIRTWRDRPTGAWPALACLGGMAAGMCLAQRTAPLRFTPAPQLKAAVALAAAWPRQIVFPRNPLVTWLAERRQTHLEWGMFDQVVAGFPPTRQRFWSGMPARLTYVVYPVAGTYFFMQLFPPVTHTTTTRHFTIYTVGPVPPATAGR